MPLLSSFGIPANNITAVVGAGGYTAGSGTLTLFTGQGALFPALGANQFYRITVIQQAYAYLPTVTLANLTIYMATGKSVDSLTGVTAFEGTTDRNYNAGDVVDIRVTAGTINDIQTALVNLNTQVNAADFLMPLSQATVSITGTTALNSDAFGRMHVCSGTSANYTVTLPSPATNAGKFIGLIMSSALTKVVTILRNSSDLIDGTPTRLMWAKETATLFCDGTHWIKVSGKSIPMACQMTIAAQQAIIDSAFVLITLNTTVFDNTGQMADTTNHLIRVVRPGSYEVLAQASWVGMPAISLNTQMRIDRNGNDEAIHSLAYVPTGMPRPCSQLMSSRAANVADYLRRKSCKLQGRQPTSGTQ